MEKGTQEPGMMYTRQGRHKFITISLIFLERYLKPKLYWFWLEERLT